MATERIIAPTASPAEEHKNWALRPQSIDEYIGQPELIERLLIAIEAVVCSLRGWHYYKRSDTLGSRVFRSNRRNWQRYR